MIKTSKILDGIHESVAVLRVHDGGASDRVAHRISTRSTRHTALIGHPEIDDILGEIGWWTECGADTRDKVDDAVVASPKFDAPEDANVCRAIRHADANTAVKMKVLVMSFAGGIWTLCSFGPPRLGCTPLPRESQEQLVAGYLDTPGDPHGILRESLRLLRGNLWESQRFGDLQRFSTNRSSLLIISGVKMPGEISANGWFVGRVRFRLYLSEYQIRVPQVIIEKLNERGQEVRTQINTLGARAVLCMKRCAMSWCVLEQFVEEMRGKYSSKAPMNKLFQEIEQVPPRIEYTCVELDDDYI
eukprot:1392800-Amorphochlora_amoeboformis.AAC.1